MTRYLVAAALALAGVVCVSMAQERPKIAVVCDEIVSTQVEIPPGLEKHEWIENPDMEDILNRAQKENRPVFVTVRCLPCRQGSWFDSELMKPKPALEGDLRNFICVRLTNMRDMDMRLFKSEEYQDLDCSWWGYFFEPEGRIYSVYGGVDINGDKTRQSVAGLQATMKRVLHFHYHPKRAEWDLLGDAPKVKGRAETPFKHDGFKSWAKHAPRAKKIVEDKNECFHCHEVAEVTRQERLNDEKFDKGKDFYVWPYPENIGVELELDHGLKVKRVIPDSPAAAFGMQPGDVIEAAGGTPIFSDADLRRVLHNLPYGDAELELLTRDAEGEGMLGTLKLTGDWRKSDLGWRKSVAEADIGAHPGFNWPLKGDRNAAGVGNDVMCVKPYYPKGPNGNAGKAGLKGGDNIIAVDGESPNVDGRAFMVWFRLNYEPGDEVTLTIVRNGQKQDITYKVGRHIDD